MILLRVEIRGSDPDGQAWRRLEADLNEAGFSKTIQRADGTRFKLPSGEFRVQEQAASSLAAAGELASAIARNVHPDVGLLLTEVQDWLALGLKVKM